MKKSLVFIAVASCLFLTAGLGGAARPFPQRVPASPTPQPGIILAYYTGSPESFAALRARHAWINVLSSDVFSVESDGSISGSDVYNAAGFAAAHGVQTYACVNNYNAHPDVEAFDPLLARAAVVTYRGTALKALMELVHGADHAGINYAGIDYAGINLDFEDLSFSDDIRRDRRDFSAFVSELARQLHADGKRLIVSVPAKSEDDPEDAWSYPYDLAALGRAADYLQLMTYDQHGVWSDPGAVAGADWVEACLRYAVSQVDARKLLIGLPAYGYDWNLDEDAAVYFGWNERAARLALDGAETHWDAGSQSPNVIYTLDGQRHAAWYENARSLRIKTALARKFALGGVSVWALGWEDTDFWRAVSAPE